MRLRVPPGVQTTYPPFKGSQQLRYRSNSQPDWRVPTVSRIQCRHPLQSRHL